MKSDIFGSFDLEIRPWSTQPVKVKYLKDRVIMHFTASSVKHRQRSCLPGSLLLRNQRCIFPASGTLNRHKENVLNLVLEIPWMSKFFSSPGEILQSEVQRPLEIVWESEGKKIPQRIRGRKRKGWKKRHEKKMQKSSWETVEERGRKLIYSLVHLIGQAARIKWEMLWLLPLQKKRKLTMKTVNVFLRTSSEISTSNQCHTQAFYGLFLTQPLHQLKARSDTEEFTYRESARETDMKFLLRVQTSACKRGRYFLKSFYCKYFPLSDKLWSLTGLSVCHLLLWCQVH